MVLVRSGTDRSHDLDFAAVIFGLLLLFYPFAVFWYVSRERREDAQDERPPDL